MLAQPEVFASIRFAGIAAIILDLVINIVTGMAASVEEDPEGGPSEEHHIKLRFDSNPPISDRWVESTNHSGLFTDDPVGFSKQLLAAQKFAFEFMPFDANPAVAQFDLKGLSSHLPKVAEACGWNVN